MASRAFLQTTHKVLNQAPLLSNYNLFTSNPCLSSSVKTFAKDHFENCVKQGGILGSSSSFELGDMANNIPPVLHTHDKYGNRSDVVTYTSAYHDMMSLGISAGVTSLPFESGSAPGAHTARAALAYMQNAIDPGHCCPLVMTFACIPVLRKAGPQSLKAQFLEKLMSRKYDGRDLPVEFKTGITIGMSMTEKQGGSDVRSNTTTATRADKTDKEAYHLVGHKWFTSAPNSDAFLTLAQVEGKGLTCFLVPRWLPDGSKNVGLQFQRLKDKMGDKSNASSEVEYRGAVGLICGEEGRGVSTILEMVHHTRLDCSVGSASAMHRALHIAAHHCSARQSFGRRLADQPLMQALLLDLSVESKAATLLTMRMARAFDDPGEAALARLGVAVTKMHVCKRQPQFVYECMEVLGGNGFVENWPLARMFRASPLNAIWEGSGNVMSLDVLRAFGKEGAHDLLQVLEKEFKRARGVDKGLDVHFDEVAKTVAGLEGLSSEQLQRRARYVSETIAVALQGVEMIGGVERGCVHELELEVFCRTRIGGAGQGLHYGSRICLSDAFSGSAKNAKIEEAVNALLINE